MPALHFVPRIVIIWPSINVPQAGTEGWTKTPAATPAFWANEENNTLTAALLASEFMCHDGSYCPTVTRPAMVKLCRVYLEPMRAKFGVSYVLSGYRHELYNARIGGARHRQHVYEDNFETVAADLRFQRGTPAQSAAYAKGLRAKAGGPGGVGRYDRSGFVHCDNRTYTADVDGMNWEEIAVAAPAAFLLGVIVGYFIRGRYHWRRRGCRSLRHRNHGGMASRRRRHARRGRLVPVRPNSLEARKAEAA